MDEIWRPSWIRPTWIGMAFPYSSVCFSFPRFSFRSRYFSVPFRVNYTLFTSGKGGGKCVCPSSFVCLSVSKIIQESACMDLDEMLRVDRCRDMDQLINFWARSALWFGCRNRIAFSDIVCAATRNYITSGKSNVKVLGARRCSDAWF